MMKINNFRGELTEILALKEALVALGFFLVCLCALKRKGKPLVNHLDIGQ